MNLYWKTWWKISGPNHVFLQLWLYCAFKFSVSLCLSMELWLSEDNFDKVSKQLLLVILRQQSTQIKPTHSLSCESVWESKPKIRRKYSLLYQLSYTYIMLNIQISAIFHFCKNRRTRMSNKILFLKYKCIEQFQRKCSP